jgi:hypothetical protein
VGKRAQGTDKRRVLINHVNSDRDIVKSNIESRHECVQS